MAENVERDMDAVVKGTKASFTELRDLTDWTAIKKVCTPIRLFAF